jgi:hypothetical protein
VTVTGSNPQSVVRAAKEVLDTIYVELAPPQEQQPRQQNIPPSVIEKLPKMSNKEIVLTLLYFEGEMSKEMINQRSRELGKEVSKEWLRGGHHNPRADGRAKAEGDRDRQQPSERRSGGEGGPRHDLRGARTASGAAAATAEHTAVRDRKAA